jgi:hypothetical protein
MERIKAKACPFCAAAIAAEWRLICIFIKGLEISERIMTRSKRI